ncbi:MAG: hypothetical protein R3C68_09640 [Myxococcota bacterium]
MTHTLQLLEPAKQCAMIQLATATSEIWSSAAGYRPFSGTGAFGGDPI